MEFFNEKIHGRAECVAKRTQSFVVSLSLLYTLLAITSLLYFSEYKLHIIGIIITLFSVWQIYRIHQPVIIATEKMFLVTVPFWELPFSKEGVYAIIENKYISLSYDQIIGFSEDWKLIYLGMEQEGGIVELAIEGTYISLKDKECIVRIIESKQQNNFNCYNKR